MCMIRHGKNRTLIVAWQEQYNYCLSVYSQQLRHLIRTVRDKHPDARYEICSTTTPNHITQPILVFQDLGSEVLPHSPYFPDLMPCDFNLFRSVLLCVEFSLTMTNSCRISSIIRSFQKRRFFDNTKLKNYLQLMARAERQCSGICRWLIVINLASNAVTFTFLFNKSNLNIPNMLHFLVYEERNVHM